MRKQMTLAAIALAAFALAGCFSSTAPIYTESEAVCPIRQQTAFATPQADAGGSLHLEPSFTIRAEGNFCVRTGGEMDAEEHRVIFAPLQDGWYVAQEFKTDNNRYYYGLVRIQGDGIWSYQPNCGDFTQAALEEVGVASPWANMFSDLAAATTGPPAAGPKQSPDVKPERPVAAESANDGSCAITTRAQIETLFRAWTRLGRPAESYGHRIETPR